MDDVVMNQETRRAEEGLKIESRSWVDPRLDIKTSALGGQGIFAKEPIKEGEIVVIWGGILLTTDEVEAGLARPHTVAAIDEGRYLGTPKDEPPSPDDFMNHSCDPNVWMVDMITLAARRGIRTGEELTADYAMWEANEDWIAPWRCRCGSPLCRKRITGKDWRLPELQERYRDHFSPFVNKRIARLGSTDGATGRRGRARL